jgi:hypothetical protein
MALVPGRVALLGAGGLYQLTKHAGIDAADQRAPVKCPKCHTENLADSIFCEECSAPLEAACPNCGTGNTCTPIEAEAARDPSNLTPPTRACNTACNTEAEK